MKMRKTSTILLTAAIFGGAIGALTTNTNVKADKVTENYNKTFNLIEHAKVVNKSVELTEGSIQHLRGGISGKEKIDLKKDFYAEIMTELGGDRYQADGIAAFFHINGENAIGNNGAGLGMARLDGFGVTLTDVKNSTKKSESYFTTSSPDSSYLNKGGGQGLLEQNEGKNFLRIKWNAKKKELTYCTGTSKVVTSSSNNTFTWKQSNFGKSDEFWKKAYNNGVTFAVTAATGSSAGAHNVTLNYYQPNIEKPKISLPEEITVDNIDKFDALKYVKDNKSITDKNLEDLTTVNGYNAYNPKYIDIKETKIDAYTKKVDVRAYNASLDEPASKTMYVKMLEDKASLKVKNTVLSQGQAYDPKDNFVSATDVKGDALKWNSSIFKVTGDKVDTQTPGVYKQTMTYNYDFNGEAKSISRDYTISVKPFNPWPNGDTDGWKMFSGEKINLINDPENSIIDTNEVFYSDKQASIYKIFSGKDALKVGKKYKVTVYFKPLTDEVNLDTYRVKVSLKEDSSSQDYRELINTTLNNGTSYEKGYYSVTNTFVIGEKESEPLINVENFQGGYIGSISILEAQ